MTTEKDIKLFKRTYCCTFQNRKEILSKFEVSVDSFEELLYGQYINSYATGERKIRNSFMILKVIDQKNEKIYYPVFSEKVAREMLNGSNVIIPRKITIFSNKTNYDDNIDKVINNKISAENNRSNSNRALLYLIELSRAYMLLNVENPSPMNGMFKQIYGELIKYPNTDPYTYKIKSVNTALGNYIKAHSKEKGFHHLDDFIKYLKNLQGCKRLKNISLEILRAKMTKDYPHEVLYF